MKLLSLLKAILSQDMNMFRYSSKKNSGKTKKIITPIFLFSMVGIAIGYYAYLLTEVLAPLNFTYIMLSIFIAIVTVLGFIEGIYKSQGILFEAKDNDMLFSLPIKKSTILFARMFKLMLFEYIYNLMFILPAFIVYAIFEKPGISFYLLSLLMTILIPIIPTVISSMLGYIVKMVSSKFKAKKIVQTLLSCLIFFGIFFGSSYLNTFVEKIATNATNINDTITKIYYPIGAYISLINNFDIITFVKLLLVNIVPLILFVLIGQKYYFTIISNLKGSSVFDRKKLVNKNIKINKPIISLTKKELKRYFSSTVYMFNTAFGLALILILTITLCFSGKELAVTLISSGESMLDGISVEMLFYGLILFAGLATSITSSSISLEGKTINITKSLPISYKTILNSKILYCFVIELPFFLISELLFAIRFKISLTFLVQILCLTFFVILLSAVIGLIVNLKYPKLDANNDTEVVKQSMSSMISVFIGFGIFFASVAGLVFLSGIINMSVLITLHVLVLAISSVILYNILMNFGTKEYQKLNG